MLEHPELIKKLYKLHILGLKYHEDELKEPIYCRFKEQLRDYLRMLYETGFIWKLAKEDLKNNKSGSLVRDWKLFTEY